MTRTSCKPGLEATGQRAGAGCPPRSRRSTDRRCFPQPSSHLGYLLRLDCQNDHVGLGSDLGVVGGTGIQSTGKPLPGSPSISEANNLSGDVSPAS